MSEAEPQILHHETFGGYTAAVTKMTHVYGGQPRPDRSSQNRHVFYIPSRQQWGSVELYDGSYMLAIWSACPCSLG